MSQHSYTRHAVDETPLPESLLDVSFLDGDELFRLRDHVRKLYKVRVPDVGQMPAEYDNSEQANDAARMVPGATVEIVCVTRTPKKSFWEVWREKKSKLALNALGVYVTKNKAQAFVITTKKPARWQFIRNRKKKGGSR